MATRHKKLSKAAVKSAGPGKYFDAWGLILLVKLSGRKSWVWRGTIHGKRCELGLGSADFVSLDEARDLAYEYTRKPGAAETRVPCAARRARRRSQRP